MIKYLIISLHKHNFRIKKKIKLIENLSKKKKRLLIVIINHNVILKMKLLLNLIVANKKQ
jgi:hypothetical protein